MENWVEVSLLTGHRLCLPPGVSGGSAQGVDTAVAAWSGPGIQILVDEGPFADPLTSYARRTNYRTSVETIDGRPACLVSFNDDDGMRVVAAHFAGSVAGSGVPDRLTVLVRLVPDRDQEVALKIIQSFRFGGQ